MNVTFYTFSKRRNSTKQPTGGASYSCVLKEGTSTSRPDIMLKWQGGGAPSAYNYAYVPAFGRYYWVNSWEYSERCWTASCSVDALATYKSQIGGSTKYVLRSASQADTDIIDTLYPAKMTYKTATTSIVSPYVSDMANGYYVLSISSGGTTGVQYIQMTQAQLAQLMQYCYQETATIWGQSMSTSNIGDALQQYGDAITKSVYNPFQYINSIMWFPISFGIDPTPGTNLRLGPMPTGINYYLLDSPTATFIYTISVPSLSSTYKWEKAAPYRQYLLTIPPFGQISLDPTLMTDTSTVTISVVWDYISGGAIAHIGCANGGYYMSLADVSGQIGIPVAAASNSIDNLGALTAKLNAATSTVGTIGSLLTGNIGGAVSSANSAVSSALSAYAALAPRVQQTGVSGGIGYLGEYHTLQVLQFDRPDTDNAEFGQPLYKVKTISSLSGYVKLADGEVDCAATEDEHRELEAFLTGGFFYE